jgi:hypothetical protein
LIGRLIGRLIDPRGLADPIARLFSSFLFLFIRQGGLGKRTVFEHDARVPLLIRDPLHPESHGRRTATIAELVDLFPTTVELSNPTTAARQSSALDNGEAGNGPTIIERRNAGVAERLASLTPPAEGASLAAALRQPDKTHKATAVTQTVRCLPFGTGKWPHMDATWSRESPTELQCEGSVYSYMQIKSIQ